MTDWNTQIIEEFRANAGSVGGRPGDGPAWARLARADQALPGVRRLRGQDQQGDPRGDARPPL